MGEACFHCQDVLQATGGRFIRGNRRNIFRGISTDTRGSCCDRLFIPLKGPRFDGHSFLATAVASGAAGVLLETGREKDMPTLSPDITVVVVPDTLAALGDLARHWRRRFTFPVVAITGTTGKTTTKEMLATILERRAPVLKTAGNLNNLVGLPQTLLQLRDHFSGAVLEMGTNRRGEIARLSRIAEPDVGLITNIGLAHLEGLYSPEQIFLEKSDLFRHLSNKGWVVMNRDDPSFRRLSEIGQGRCVTFGFTPDVDVRATDINMSAEETDFTLRLCDKALPVRLPAAGLHNVTNALGAAAAAWVLKMDLHQIGEGLASFKTSPGRMEIIHLSGDRVLVNDAYNANPTSVAAALEMLQTIQTTEYSTVVLGDMLELGEQAGMYHERVGERLAAMGIRRVFLKGDYAKATASGALRGGLQPDRIHVFQTDDDLIAQLLASAVEGEWILVKGSRGMKMERIVEHLVGCWGRTALQASTHP